MMDNINFINAASFPALLVLESLGTKIQKNNYWQIFN